MVVQQSSNSGYADQTRICRECGDVFDWSANEQKWYEDRGFKAPNRCKPCRQFRNQERAEAGQRAQQALQSCIVEREISGNIAVSLAAAALGVKRGG
jgi:Probable zinc-ribbon domain